LFEGNRVEKRGILKVFGSGVFEKMVDGKCFLGFYPGVFKKVFKIVELGVYAQTWQMEARGTEVFFP